MELILKQDVENLGFKDDIVTVKNGYGRNFLIPQKQAVLATASAKKVLAENLKQRAYKDKKIIEDANKTAEAIKALEIKIPAKATEGASAGDKRSEEHTSEIQSREKHVCRLLLEKKKKN